MDGAIDIDFLLGYIFGFSYLVCDVVDLMDLLQVAYTGSLCIAQ